MGITIFHPKFRKGKCVLKTMVKRINVLIFFVLVLSVVASSLPAGAQKQNEYFEYTITGELDKKGVQINEQFNAILSSQGICKVDMPINISDVMVDIRIYARNKKQNSEITLVPDYSLPINDIPTAKGQTFIVENKVSLIFPSDSPDGIYEILVDIIKAEFKIFGFRVDGLEYMPTNPIQISYIEVYSVTTYQANINPNLTARSTTTPARENESSIPPGSIESTHQTANIIDPNSQSSDGNSRQFIYRLIIGTGVCLIVLVSVLFIIWIKRKSHKS